MSVKQAFHGNQFGHCVTPIGKLVEPAVSTSSTPGTPQKLAVMTQRIQNGESCFHPKDKSCFNIGDEEETQRIPTGNKSSRDWVEWIDDEDDGLD